MPDPISSAEALSSFPASLLQTADVGGTGAAPLSPREEERLALLQACQILDTPEDPDFDDLTRLASQVCGTPIALISLVDEQRQWFKSRQGLAAPETPRRLAFCSHTILTPERLMVVPDAALDARFADNDLVTGPPHIRFYAGAPLVLEDGLALGSLCVIDQVPRTLTAEQQKALAALARQVVSQIRLRQQNRALQQAQAERDQFFNLPLDMLCIAGMDGYFKQLNPAFSETLGFSMEELLARPFIDFVHPDDLAATLREVETLGGGVATTAFENRYRCQDGTFRWLSWRSALGEGGLIYASARDISLRKRREDELQESEKRFREAIEYSAIGMALVGMDGSWLKVNRALCAIVGRTEGELSACTFQEITHPEDLDADLANLKALLAGEITHYQMEKRYLHKDGRTIWVLLAVTLVRDAEGAPVHFVSQIEDITERHLAEKLLKASLEEKEILLKEIHHRVKNNLQVVSSLLQLQSQGLTEPKLLALFREAQDRVRAMTLIHEGLYRTGQLAAVNFGTHLRELVAVLLRSYSTGGVVRLAAETESIELDLDVAVPLSLIVNELVTNALKYGYQSGEGGLLHVEFRALEKNMLFLSIGDEGPGLPASFDWQRSTTLGMKIVNILARQIGGRLELVSVPRVAFAITFPRRRTAQGS